MTTMTFHKTLAAAILLAAASLALAQAQEAGPRASLDTAKPQASEECRRLQDRVSELDRMDDERIARAGHTGAQQSPVQTKEWIDRERKDAKTKMFFAKC
ncbi:MAG: hypothetical protein JWQ61_2035 [Collimonas fungivorans]|nr:hypothetical protein [Collimonas fungivorans]